MHISNIRTYARTFTYPVLSRARARHTAAGLGVGVDVSALGEPVGEWPN